MKQLDREQKYSRLWEYTIKVATGLRDMGFPTDDLDCPLNDWIKDVEELIYEAGDKDITDGRKD